MADVVSPSLSGSSSSTSVVGGVNVALMATIPGERLVNPNCACGAPSSLKISWTDLNPGRRFFKCNRCNFFLWVDPKVNWYNYVVKHLLRKNSALAVDVIDMRQQIVVHERNNRKLQEGLDEYLVKLEEHAHSVLDLKAEVEKMRNGHAHLVVDLKAELEKMRSGEKVYKRVIVALVVLVVVLLMK